MATSVRKAGKRWRWCSACTRRRARRQAGLILAELLDWTRAVLRRNRVVAKKFQLELPLKASIPDPEKQWMEYHMATVFPEYQYIIPSTPLGGTLKEHTYE